MRKRKSSETEVSKIIPTQLLDEQHKIEIKKLSGFSKVLGMEWNYCTDSFQPMVSSIMSVGDYTKWELVSRIARLYDVLRWCSPTIVLAKILLQRVWEEGRSWDEPVSCQIRETWEKWHSQLPVLQNHFIPRTYFPKQSIIVSKQLHGFSDTFESTYAGAI